MRRTLVLMVFAGTMLAACGGGDSGESATTTSAAAPASTTTSAAPAPTTTTVPAIPGCHTSEVSATFVNPDAGAGQRYLTLVLTNNATHNCEVFGYVGMQLLDSGGVHVATNVVRIDIASRAHVLVPPGGQVSSLLHWGAMPGPGEPQDSACEPTPTQVQITPPNETAFLVVPWTFGAVCAGGSVDTKPLQLGVPSP